MRRAYNFFRRLLLFCTDLVIVVAEGMMVFLVVLVDFLDSHIGGN